MQYLRFDIIYENGCQNGVSDIRVDFLIVNIQADKLPLY